MASSKSSYVGVISPKLFWSAHENELRVHNAVDLERHAGHGTSGLPEQALFRFCATGRGAPTLHHAAVDELGSGRRLSDGGDKLTVRDVESVELGDGRTVLMCLVSSPGLKSEIHCVDPALGETLGVTAGLSIMLTKLAVLPKASLCARGMAGSTVGNRGCGNDDRRFVVAVGGIVGRVELAGVQAEADSPRDQPEAVPGSALVPREREGVPVSALVAFSAKGRGKQERIMIAAGWDDGQWSLRQYSDGRAAEVNGGLAEPPEPGLEVTGDTRGSGPVLRIVHQPDDSGPAGTLEEPSAIRLWLCNAKGLLLYEVSLGSSPDAAAPPTPHLRRAHVRNLLPDARPQCLRAMAVGGGLPRELFAFACLRPRDSTPVLQVLDMSNTWVASTVAPSKGLGGTDSANPLEDTSRERLLGNCRARAPVADPTEVVMGAENGAGDEEAVVQEVELSTRCCGNSVVSARLHAVWVNPADVKIFVSGRRGIGSELVGAEQRRRRRLQPMGSPGAEEGNDHGAATCHEGGETREEDRPGAAAAWRRSTVGGHGRVEKLHLKMSIIVGEASLSETGRARVRAWQYSHLGDAHRVAMEAEKLGHLGFYDPSQEVWDTATKRLVTAVGEETLEHVIGGGSRGDLDDGAGTLWGQPRCTTVSGVDDGDPDLDVAQRSVGTVVVSPISHRPHVTCDTRSGGYWLAARLQGAVMLGRGPEIARALTASAAGAGDWMLRRAQPVQEWALAVTEEAWDEIRVFFVDEVPALLDGSGKRMMGRLDVLARRAKQLERILDASVRRCQVTCEASAAEVASQSGVRKSITLRRHAGKVSAMSNLRTHLEHAMVAAQLTSSLASAASFLIGRGSVAADGSGSLGVVRSVTAGVYPTGVRDESSMHSAADEGIVGARCRSGDECGSNDVGGRLMVMRDRLLQLAGVVPGELRLYEMLRAVSSMVFDSFPWVNKMEDTVSSTKRLDAQRATRVLETGLTALAYSVMTEASGSLDAPRAGDDQPGARKERFALEAAEQELDLFGEQVQLSSEARVRARLSWLLDRSRTSRAALLAAGSALLCPRAILSVAGDRVLAEQAAANLMVGWRQPAEEEEEEEEEEEKEERGRGDAGRKKRSASAFAPLVEELLRLARAEGGRESMGLEHENHGAERGTEGAASRAAKRSRHSFPPDYRSSLSALKRPSPQGEIEGLGASVADDRGVFSPGVNGNGSGHSELEMEQDQAAVGERRREQGVTPLLGGGTPWHSETFLPVEGMDSEVVDGLLSIRTAAVVEERTPGRERSREMETPSSGDGDKFSRRRERGQTVWQTPRGVGFTPMASRNSGGDAPIGAGTIGSRKRALDIARRYHRTPTSSVRGVGSPGDSPALDSPAIDHGVGSSRSSLRFSSPDDSETPEVPRRNRGQTVWETPRGVGLTPKTLTVSQLSSRPIGFTPKGGRVRDDGRGSKTAQSMLSRMRGQTVWQTPRGVGLTPRTPSHALRREDHDAGAASGDDKMTEGASETKMSARWDGRGDMEASPMESPPLGQSAFRSFAEGN